RPQKTQLNVGRERGADTVGIDGVGGQSLGLEENLVAVAVGEAMNLVLDRRAIAGTCRSDRASKQRRTVQVLANDFMSSRIGPCDRAKYLRIAAPGRKRGHRPWIGVRKLLLEPCPVDRSPVEPWRRPRLEARHGQHRLA